MDWRTRTSGHWLMDKVDEQPDSAATSSSAGPRQWLGQLVTRLGHLLDVRILLAAVLLGGTLAYPLFSTVSPHPVGAPAFAESWQLWREDVRRFWVDSIETNAWLRLQQAPVAMTAVAAGEDGLVAVAGDGRIFYSTDAGRFWNEAQVEWGRTYSTDSIAGSEEETGAEPESRRIQSPEDAKFSGGNTIDYPPADSASEIDSVPTQRSTDNPEILVAMTLVGETGWAVGEDGVVLTTLDAGRSWRAGIVDASRPELEHVAFADATTGWAGTDDTIYLTTDGGATWAKQAELRGIASIMFDGGRLYVLADDRAGTMVYSMAPGEATAPVSAEVVPSSSPEFLSVAGGTVWVAGYSGELYRGSGAGWEKIEFADAVSATEDEDELEINALHASGPDSVALGLDKEVLITTDGGASWRVRPRFPEEFPNLIIDGATSVEWVDEETGLLATGAVDRVPQLTLGGLLVDVAGRDEYWLVAGIPGLLSEDSGRTWRALPEPAGFTSGIAQLDDSSWLLAGRQGVFRYSLSGGLEILNETDSDSLRQVFFDSAHTGWILDGDDDLAYYSTDGGVTFTEIGLGGLDTPSTYFGAHHNGALWIPTTDGLHRIADGGTANDSTPIGPRDVVGVAFAPDDLSWAITADGALHQSADAWVTSEEVGRIEAIGDEFLRLQYVDGALFLIDGDRGLLRSLDGGRTWERLDTGDRLLFSVARGASGELWRLGFGPVLEASTDDGSTWGTLVEYGQSAPPLSFLFLFLSTLVVVSFVSTRKHESGREDEMLASFEIPAGASDAPAVTIEADTLNRKTTVFALSRLIRNTETEYPLTIAITGGWGSGKSSIMGMLRGELDKAGFMTLWFNAWHHASDDNLLTALLDGIAKDALPAWHTVRGMVIHIRLIMGRVRNHPVFLTFMLILAAFLTGLFGYGFAELKRDMNVAVPVSRALAGLEPDAGKTLTAERLCREPLPGDLAAWIAGSAPFQDISCTEPGDRLLGPLERSVMRAEVFTQVDSNHTPVAGNLAEWLYEWFTIIAISFGGLMLLFLTLLPRLRDSVAMFQGLARAQSRMWGINRGQRTDPGLRYRVSHNLEEICRVLPYQRPLVVFIDDVDRCTPEQQLEVLEVVNFLTEKSEKRVLVIIGCSVEVTLPSIASRFDETVRVKELANNPGKKVLESHLALRKQQYAEQYLRKIFNLEQPCDEPVVLVHADEAEDSVPSRPWIRQLDQFALSVPMAIGLALLGYTLAQWLLAPGVDLVVETATVAEAQLPKPTATAAAAAVQTTPELTPDEVRVVMSEPVEITVVPATKLVAAERSLEVFGWLLFPIGILLYHLVSFRYDHAEDSKAFRDVVGRLKRVLTYWGPTPRQEGRVMNQLRLIAAKAQLRDNKDGYMPLRLVVLRVFAELARIPDLGATTELLNDAQLTGLLRALGQSNPGYQVMQWSKGIVKERYGEEETKSYIDRNSTQEAAVIRIINELVRDAEVLFKELGSARKLFLSLTANRQLT